MSCPLTLVILAWVLTCACPELRRLDHEQRGHVLRPSLSSVWGSGAVEVGVGRSGVSLRT